MVTKCYCQVDSSVLALNNSSSIQVSAKNEVMSDWRLLIIQVGLFAVWPFCAVYMGLISIIFLHFIYKSY